MGYCSPIHSQGKPLFNDSRLQISTNRGVSNRIGKQHYKSGTDNSTSKTLNTEKC